MSANPCAVRERIVLSPACADQFTRVCRDGDVALAIAIVRASRPPLNSIITATITVSGDGQEEQTFVQAMSPLQYAIQCKDVALVRALIEEGADVGVYVRQPVPKRNDFEELADAHDIELTAVGGAMLVKNSRKRLSLLSILHAAGADLGRAKRQNMKLPAGSPRGEVGSAEYSALLLELVLGDALDMACVRFLLDETPVDGACFPCSCETDIALLRLARRGSAAIPVLKILVARGLNIKALDAVDGRKDHLAIELLKAAQEEEEHDKKLLLYFVGDLGLSASVDLDFITPGGQKKSFSVSPAYSREFWRACRPGNVAVAMPLVRGALPPINSLISATYTQASGCQEVLAMSALQWAVHSENVALVRALIEEGADLSVYIWQPPCCDSLDCDARPNIPGADESAVTAVLAAIQVTDSGKRLELLSILHEAGADFGRVKRQKIPVVGPSGDFRLYEYSALHIALEKKLNSDSFTTSDALDMACIRFLIDETRVDGRCLPNNLETKLALGDLATRGAAAIPVFKMLVAGGLDVKALDTRMDGSDVLASAALLATAAEGRDKRLLRYFVGRTRALRERE